MIMALSGAGLASFWFSAFFMDGAKLVGRMEKEKSVAFIYPSKYTGHNIVVRSKTKAYALAADYGYGHHQSQQQGRKPVAVAKKGDYLPVFIAIGMIVLSVGFGLHKAWHQLRTSQTVRVKKQRRETLPEVVEPKQKKQRQRKKKK
ncbi:hypothetical protein K1719_031591 [Acacia pycnantha]|nr:hypothetical protein K1719_031591 [Acacia pycnantha]